MTIKSGFFNSVGGDRKYDASKFAEYFNSFIGNGVFPNPSSNLQVMANDDMTITIKAGKAWINGYILTNDDDYILNIDVADGILNRIDRVVARYDVVDREIRLEVKKGIFASSPAAPTLQRDADAYELGIADIYVGKGVISINQGNITDLRQYSELCGIVHGTVDQVDVTTLYNQYTDGFILKQDEFEQEFLAWFATLQDVLDENTATNLLNMINNLQTEVTTHKADYAYQTPVINGSQIQVTRLSDTERLYFRLEEDFVSNEAITISLDEGATEFPLLDIEGEPVTELQKGFVEVIKDAVNFTLRPRGGGKKWANGIINNGDKISTAYTITGLNFKPRVVIMQQLSDIRFATVYNESNTIYNTVQYEAATATRYQISPFENGSFNLSFRASGYNQDIIWEAFE